MPKEFIARQTSEVTLEWLAVLNQNESLEKLFAPDYSKVVVPQGSAVFMDDATSRFRVLTPEKKIIAWDRFKQVRVDPGEYWGVTWRKPDQVKDPDFGFFKKDGKLSILLENIEGNEHLFADYVATMSDPQLCPVSFRAPDGRYESNRLVDFMVTWGGDRIPPRLEPVKETLAVQPEVPSEFMIEIEPGTTVNCVRSKGPVEAEPGIYVGDVRTHNIFTGEVIDIRFRFEGKHRAFNTTGAELFRLVAAKQAAIVKIIQDRMLQY